MINTPTELCLLGYIGPGGGFVISSSFLTLLLTIFGVVAVVILAPLSSLLALIRGRRRRYPHGFRKVVVLGLDGLDPKVVRRLMTDHKLPHIERLAGAGCFAELRPTMPAISPSVWSSFSVGGDPSQHNIYDFVKCDSAGYQTRLSSYEVVDSPNCLRLGPWRIPLGKAQVRSLRKGTPFWRALGGAGVEATIVRVPVTFPPEPFRGRLMAGMCLPDARGTQGVYSYYATKGLRRSSDGGDYLPLHFENGTAHTQVRGPAHPWRLDGRTVAVPLAVCRVGQSVRIVVRIQGHKLELTEGQTSEWVRITFRIGWKAVSCLVQFYAKTCTAEVELYMTPVHLDPERPPMALSHPGFFTSFLAKKVGPFGTLGLMEDTSALNDGALDEKGFLDQAWERFAERKRIFFSILDDRADDVVVCVFDTPDRIQHMFWRYTDAGHPALGGQTPGDNAGVIDCMYGQMDVLVGETLERLTDDTLLLVVSDHGFTSFRRQVDLNAWLLEHGYLYLLPGASGDTLWLGDIDWVRTKAFAVGLTGLYLNLCGRQSHGIVSDGDDAQALLTELQAGLQAMEDTDTKTTATPQRAIRRVHIPRSDLAGPYTVDGPDLLVGYEAGYRCSWSCARGQVGRRVFTDNLRPWSGDHCVDAEVVPGVLISNTRLKTECAGIIDIGPTVLDVFGLRGGPTVQGKSLITQTGGPGDD